MSQDLVLLPRPRTFKKTSKGFRLPSKGTIYLRGNTAQEGHFAARRVQDALRKDFGSDWSISAADPEGRPGIFLTLGSSRIKKDEGYELEISGKGVRVEARTRRGLLHGVSTFLQVLKQKGLSLPGLRIGDHPDFAHRGLMLDVSRDKVPTMATAFALVDLLASWKINQIQLYTEHTFAYRNHREVWKNSSPFTGEEILELDRYCQDRGIELIPNQNSFGHMRRWLVLPKYRPLADAPEGCDTIWGRFDEPFTINPLDPRCLKLLQELYDELLPHFSSHQFNVGCDETVDLGKVKSKKAADKIGVGRLYLDFLLKIYKEVRLRGKKMQFWGDVILRHPELIRRLPKDSVALNWGYEFDHPFPKETAAFRRAGIPFYVCPGTATWQTIVGKYDNMKGNTLSAAVNGLKNGAVGLLNTDWGDNGHWQYQPFSYPGYAYGAALSWNVAANKRLDLTSALNTLVFEDSTGRTARALIKLGVAYKTAGPRIHNATSWGQGLLRNLKGVAKMEGQTPATWSRGIRDLASGLSALNGAKPASSDGALILREMRAAVRLAIHGCRRGLLALEQNPKKAASMKKRLNKEMKEIISDHKVLWHARNRPGGFKESVGRMEEARKSYI